MITNHLKTGAEPATKTLCVQNILQRTMPNIIFVWWTNYCHRPLQNP